MRVAVVADMEAVPLKPLEVEMVLLLGSVDEVRETEVRPPNGAGRLPEEYGGSLSRSGVSRSQIARLPSGSSRASGKRPRRPLGCACHFPIGRAKALPVGINRRLAGFIGGNVSRRSFGIPMRSQ